MKTNEKKTIESRGSQRQRGAVDRACGARDAEATGGARLQVHLLRETRRTKSIRNHRTQGKPECVKRRLAAQRTARNKTNESLANDALQDLAAGRSTTQQTSMESHELVEEEDVAVEEKDDDKMKSVEVDAITEYLGPRVPG